MFGLGRGARPNAAFRGVAHGEHRGVLADLDRDLRVAAAVQQLAAPIHELPAFDAVADRLLEDVVARQDRQRDRAELVAQYRRGDLPLFQRGAIPDVGGSVGIILRQTQLVQVAERANHLTLARAWALGGGGEIDRGMRQIGGRQAELRGIEKIPIAGLDGDRDLMLGCHSPLQHVVALMLGKLHQPLCRLQVLQGEMAGDGFAHRRHLRLVGHDERQIVPQRAERRPLGTLPLIAAGDRFPGTVSTALPTVTAS